MQSCCICGLVLASKRSEFPRWCTDIAALCWFGGRPILTGTGYLDSGGPGPYNLPVPGHGSNCFAYRRNLDDQIEGYCYPMHAACLKMLQETDRGGILDHHVEGLFSIFESIHFKNQSSHYNRHPRSLSWWHDYYFDDIPDCFLDNDNRVDIREDTDPLHFEFSETWHEDTIHHFVLAPRKLTSPITSIHCLPPEILLLVLCNLDFRDILQLQLTSATFYSRFGRCASALPSLFWESRFWIHGETGFARSLRPSSYSWSEWFFRIKYEMKDGLNMNLRNRQRIWKLAVDLINLIHAIQEPDRDLHGDYVETRLPRRRELGEVDPVLRTDIAIPVPNQMRGYMATCLAQEYGSEGCEVLRQRSAHLSKRSRLRSISLSYVAISNQKVVSGFSLEFYGGRTLDMGYVVAKHRRHTDPVAPPNILWLVFSHWGIEAVTINAYPQQFLDNLTSKHRSKVAIARWSVENIREIRLGLDAMRIVRVSIDVYKKDGIDNIFWSPPRPSVTPCICQDDIAFLYKMQSESFAPASVHYIDPEAGILIAIKVYSFLGDTAGIAGIGFVYHTGAESKWGSVENSASIAFFLDSPERLVKITVYKIGSLVCHIQFTTSLRRTSDIIPQVPAHPTRAFERVEYQASSNEYIVGFSGCFVASYNQLYCFGVIPTASATAFKLTSQTFWSSLPSDNRLPPMTLGGLTNHGDFGSSLLLGKRYKSVQASVNLAISKYRRIGQVTGLVFRSSDDPSHPDLLGQWTGSGAAYDFDDDEQIIDLKFTTIVPLLKQGPRWGLTQVESITIATNRRRIQWSIGTTGEWVVEPPALDTSINRITKIVWEFNAVFDRVLCS